MQESTCTSALWVCPLCLLLQRSEPLVRAEGAVKEGIVGNIVATFVNILLDPLFILAFGMGVAGAAAATVIGNLVGTLYYVYFMRKKAVVLNMSIRLAAKNRKELFSVLFLGMPNALSSYIVPDLPLTFSNRLLRSYGTGAIAAWRQQESLRC